MSIAQRISWGVIVSTALTLAAWIFVAGGAYSKACRAVVTADAAALLAGDNRVEIRALMARQEDGQKAIMRELDQIQAKLEK
jgi:hypothetical protein